MWLTLKMPSLDQARAFFYSALAALVMCGTLSATTARAQLLDDSTNVKIMAVQSQALLINNSYFKDMLKAYGLPTSPEDFSENYVKSIQCGSVSIGNNFASDELGGEITVIIVGDVLNVANNCGG